MTVGLFIPCYVDQFYPRVAVACLELLEKQGCRVDFPQDQTCCGQPMANAGFASMTTGCNRNFIRNFKDYDYIVAPSRGFRHATWPWPCRQGIQQLPGYVLFDDSLGIKDFSQVDDPDGAFLSFQNSFKVHQATDVSTCNVFNLVYFMYVNTCMTMMTRRRPAPSARKLLSSQNF